MTGRGAVAGVVLAAGSSRRLGQPKQLLPHRDRPLLQHAIDLLAEADLVELVVVLGHAATAIEAAIVLPPGARVVLNEDHRSGLASSLQAGLAALGPDAHAALVLLGDQPGMPLQAIRLVLDAYRTGERPAVRAGYRGGVAGHPVVLDRSLWSAVGELRGDRGAGGLLSGRPEDVQVVVLDVEPPPDIDTWPDYARLPPHAEQALDLGEERAPHQG